MTLLNLGSNIFVFCTSLIFGAFALEDARPEIFLPPRNFNPHPYQAGFRNQGSYLEPILSNNIDLFQSHGQGQFQQIYYRPSYVNNNPNTGPVLFPPEPEEPVVTSKPVIDRLKEIHPYAAVVKKKKYKQIPPERYIKEEHRANTVGYKALANHAVKVLTQNIPQHFIAENGQEFVDYSDQKKDYEFSYKVENQATGDDFSHTQSQNSHATNGEYRVKLPDGRVQIVSYTADKNGYKADVTYAEDTGPRDEPAQIHEQEVVLQKSRVNNDNQATQDYDYGIYEQSQPNSNHLPLYEDNSYSGHLPQYPPLNQNQPNNNIFYQLQQQPRQHNAHQNVIPQPNVQIYTLSSGATPPTQTQQYNHNNNVFGYSTTAAPPVRQLASYMSTVAPPVREIGNYVSTIAPSVREAPRYLGTNSVYSTVAPNVGQIYESNSGNGRFRLDIGKK